MFSFSMGDFLFLSFIKFEGLANFVLKSREIAYIIEIIYIFQVVYILVFGLLRVTADYSPCHCNLYQILHFFLSFCYIFHFSVLLGM